MVIILVTNNESYSCAMTVTLQWQLCSGSFAVAVVFHYLDSQLNGQSNGQQRTRGVSTKWSKPVMRVNASVGRKR